MRLRRLDALIVRNVPNVRLSVGCQCWLTMLPSTPSLVDRGTGLAPLRCEYLRREGSMRGIDSGATTIFRGKSHHARTSDAGDARAPRSRDRLESQILHAGDAETRVFMRVLYEDVLARINVLGEGDDSER